MLNFNYQKKLEAKKELLNIEEIDKRRSTEKQPPAEDKVITLPILDQGGQTEETFQDCINRDTHINTMKTSSKSKPINKKPEKANTRAKIKTRPTFDASAKGQNKWSFNDITPDIASDDDITKSFYYWRSNNLYALFDLKQAYWSIRHDIETICLNQLYLRL